MKKILFKTQRLIQVLSMCENALKSIPKCTSNVVNIDGGSITEVAIRHVISLIYVSQHFSMFAYCATYIMNPRELITFKILYHPSIFFGYLGQIEQSLDLFMVNIFQNKDAGKHVFCLIRITYMPHVVV